jgi:usherin
VDLEPFTSYSFQVTAENGAGNVTSISTEITTLQAPPIMFAAPSAVVISATEIEVSWDPPLQLNGVLLGYQVYRDGEPLLSELTFALTYLEQELLPFTEYAYFVEVCTGGGCLNSTVVSNTTLEALPEIVSDLVVSSLTARSLVLSWREPALPNGVITEYVVTSLDAAAEVFRGFNLTTTLSELTPFTDYTFSLMTCNSAGCVASNVTRIRTLEAEPEDLNAPVLRNLSSTSVAIRWMAPARPNGIITLYILRRSNDSFPNISMVIFQGLDTSFNDINLLADTQYSYTIEAVNGGGSVVSSPSFFETVPDLAADIQPPILEVRGAREISISWSPPGLPNGEIFAYMLFQDNEVVFTSLGLSYVARGLVPFTMYSFFVEVCNQAGCASSISVSAVTDQALADGVVPPLLNVLSPTAVMVSWTTPTQPNGIISQYQIRRRLLNVPISESLQQILLNPEADDILSFVNSALTPFTDYEYRLRVTNGAGSVFSEWAAVQTSEDIPVGVSLPIITDDGIGSRTVTASWAPPTSPNGIISGYVLEYRLALDPLTLGPGEIITAQEVDSNVTVAMATGLSPVTEYQFRVVAVNGAGRGLGSFADVITREDLPEGTQLVVVEQRTGSTLLLTWTPPLIPNGMVSEYRILLNGETVYRDSALTYTVTRLQPFTSYTIQLASCTSIGCDFGRNQTVTTAQVTPAGLDPPTLLSVSTGGGVQVSWIPPAQPNGIINRYEVSRRDGGSGVATVIFSSNDTSNLMYTDTSVQPATRYEYSIAAFNSAGRVESSFAMTTTPEAAPVGLVAPVLTVINASVIQVAWLPPSQPNGAIVRYQLFRTGGGSQNMSAFSTPDPMVRSYSDVSLTPFTSYTYIVQACTLAGCSLSPPGVSTTAEATPTNLQPPILRALTEASISIAWAEPGSPNGVVIRYTVTILPPLINVVLLEATELNRTISNLLPHTEYTVILEACNSAGCVSSNGTVTTLESIPEFTAMPQATVVNSTALNVSWAGPARPNGVIVLYELRRNGSLVYSAPGMSFVDAQLLPNQSYSYTLRAFTSIGPGEESPASNTIMTPPDTPMGVAPPSLQATSRSSITAMWVEPSMPNGEIQRYILLLDGENIFEGIAFRFNVTNLSAFTSYTFQLMVCTSTCANSSSINETTLEAPPIGQAPPAPQEVGNSQTVVITWSPPSTPNGIITRYELERRQVFVQASPSEFASVFNGNELNYTDTGTFLQAAMSYEYRVTSFNGVGSSTSDTANILLAHAAPDGVPTPNSANITASSVVVSVPAPPETPNGDIVNYTLLVNDTRRQTIQPPVMEFFVSNLSPFTVYNFVIEACTIGGCSVGPGVILKTGEATPTDHSPPMAMPTSPRTIQISWVEPEQPNGIILRYIYMPIVM